MARKKGGGEESGGSWMDTYGDMVTLLLTFFIVLYSMSSIEESKWAEIVKAFNKNGKTKVDQIVLVVDGDGDSPAQNTGDSEPEGQGLTEFDEFYTALVEYLDEQEATTEVAEQGEDESSDTSNGTNKENIYLRFQDMIAFEPDTAVLRESSYDFLDFFGQKLSDIEDKLAVVIIKGHTAIYDSSEVDARILSSERASTIANYLETNYNIEPKKLFPLGLSNLYPVADNKSEDGRMKNRRVEISIIGVNSPLIKDDLLKSLIGMDYDYDKLLEGNSLADAVTGDANEASDEEKTEDEGEEKSDEGSEEESDEE
ncbi:flagellar motor protein MotB [Ruminococcus sp. NK3A76]|uniref:OmpA/MotB family protein n=1 Tax=Ruminococcus sp. NK3A76 TaxID=877411 RepID=UPI00048D44C0|nr:flagellar motor protein MotB [Ruminococcus sp. NK3A76]